MNMKKNLYLLLFLISLFIVPYSVNAEDVISCDYGSSGLKFEYSGSNPKPKIISDFVSGKKYFHLLTLIESGQDQTVTEHIDMNQKWYALYHETPCACPTKLYVCTSTEYSINFPTLKGSVFAGVVQFLEMLDEIAKDIDSFGAGLNVVLKGISAGINFIFGSNVNLTVGEWDLSSIITDELIADVGDNAYALFTVNDRHLYILTEDEYKKSDFAGKKTGFYSDRGEYFMSNKDVVCKLGDCSIWIIDFLTDKLADAKTDLDLIIDLFTEDQIVLGGYREISCKTVEYSGECDTFDVNCDFFTRDEVEYKKLVKKYKDCNSDSTCKTSLLMDIHELEAVMDEKCKIVLKNYLYSDAQMECVKNCVDLPRLFNEWRKGTDLYEDELGKNINNQCRMSSRLVAWIMKIIEWIRYIVPILLIVLSVLDFIKAVASDSDDEIRKVGAKFVKRLIVAALIFVLPLLLEFLLGIFNIPIKDFCL